MSANMGPPRLGGAGGGVEPSDASSASPPLAGREDATPTRETHKMARRGVSNPCPYARTCALGGKRRSVARRRCFPCTSATSHHLKADPATTPDFTRNEGVPGSSPGVGFNLGAALRQGGGPIWGLDSCVGRYLSGMCVRAALLALSPRRQLDLLGPLLLRRDDVLEGLKVFWAETMYRGARQTS